MRTRLRRVWAGVLAASLGVAAAGPSPAAPPPARAPAASKATEEAKRLAAEVDRLRDEGKSQEALPLAQRALALREKALGPDHPDVAESLDEIAALYGDKGDYVRPEPLFQRALAIREKALGRDHPDVAVSLNHLAVLYWHKGDYARAEALFQRALAIREKALGRDHPDVAESLDNLAVLYHAKGDDARAEPLFQRAISIQEKALGRDHLDVSQSLNNLAELYHAKGDDARAEPLLRRALAIREKALGPDHPGVASVLNNLANLYQVEGDYARAEALFLRSLAILEKALGPDHPSLAPTLNNLACVYRDKGDYARAEALFLRSLAILEKALGRDHPDVALALDNLANLYQFEGDYARAEAPCRRSLAILERALGPDHPDLAPTLNNLGEIYREQGDSAHAESLFQRALTIAEKAFGPDHRLVAIALENLGMLYLDRGDTARAEPLLQRVSILRETALGPDHPDLARSFDHLLTLYLVEGRLPQALNAAERAADIQDRNAAAILATGSEEQRRLYMNTLVDDTHRGISLHVQFAPTAPDAARLALTILLRRKGRVLDAMTDSVSALRRSFAPGDRELLDRLVSVYARISAQASRGPGKAPPEQYRRDLAAIEQERQALEADVGARSAAFRAEQHLVTLADVQAKIPPGAALVEIARYSPVELHAGSPARPGPPRYVAYVLHPTFDPTFADLGEAAPLEAAASAFRRALGDPDTTHDPRPAARALDRMLMAPIRPLLGDTRWIFLSPDGVLNLVPFGALVDAQGRYLVQRYLVSYLTSGRDLLRFSDTPPPPRESPLILAAPAFDDTTAPPTPQATHRDVRSIDMVTHALRPLDGTADEARAIARLFPDSRVLLGREASEAAVEAAHGPLLLHLATHGFFLPEQPVPEVLLQNPGAKPTPAERVALLQRESPLLRSGVALAGFNKRQQGSDAGVLTALEAAGLDLYGTRLVVLSTCESGLGEASAGEGVYGMRRALTMAGAETQVMSLWQVDTGRTREMMEAYYQRLKAGEGRSEAMRDVQLAMLADSKTTSPNLWASFIVSGEWRPLEGGSRLPDLGKVAPSARGCACGQAGGEPYALGGWAVVGLALAATWRRARRGVATR